MSKDSEKDIERLKSITRGTKESTNWPKKVERAEDLSDDVLLCRLNHLFVFRYDFDVVTTEGEIVEFSRLFICPRCDTHKTETIDARTFKVIKRKMEYPDGYQVKKTEGGTRLFKHDVRRIQFNRNGIPGIPAPQKTNIITTKEYNNEDRTGSTEPTGPAALPQGTVRTESGSDEGQQGSGPVQQVSSDDGLGALGDSAVAFESEDVRRAYEGLRPADQLAYEVGILDWDGEGFVNARSREPLGQTSKQDSDHGGGQGHRRQPLREDGE